MEKRTKIPIHVMLILLQSLWQYWRSIQTHASKEKHLTSFWRRKSSITETLASATWNFQSWQHKKNKLAPLENKVVPSYNYQRSDASASCANKNLPHMFQYMLNHWFDGQLLINSIPCHYFITRNKMTPLCKASSPLLQNDTLKHNHCFKCMFAIRSLN